MSQHPATPTGREVINYDGLWGDAADPRWFHIGDGSHRISLGRSGISQTVVIYGLAGAVAAFVLHRLPVTGALMAMPGWWMWAALLVMGFATAAKVRPDGLAMHIYLPVVVADAFRARHQFGWAACEDPDRAWRPEQLPLTGSGR